MNNIALKSSLDLTSLDFVQITLEEFRKLPIYFFGGPYIASSWKTRIRGIWLRGSQEISKGVPRRHVIVWQRIKIHD